MMGCPEDIWCSKIRSFYKNVSSSACINQELSESSRVGVGVSQGCVMLPWQFSIYKDGCMGKKSQCRGFRSKAEKGVKSSPR